MQPASPSPAERPNHTTLWVVGGLILALILAVAGNLLYTRLRGDDSSSGTAAVTSMPKEVWSWKSDEDVAYAQDLPGGGALVLLSGDDHGIVTLDESGKEVWRDEKHPYNMAIVQQDEKLIKASWYVAQASSSGSTSDSGTILFAFDGTKTWEAPKDASLYSIEKDGDYLLYDDAGISKVGPKSGEERWTVEGSDFAVAEKAIYMLEGDAVVGYDLDGKETWRTSLPAGHEDGLGEYDQTRLSAFDEMVLVDSGSFVALAPATGEQLWTDDAGGEVIQTADDRFVAMPTSEYDPDTGEKKPLEGPFPIFGADGHVGDVDLATSGAYLTMEEVTLDGREVNFHQPSGILFEADGTVIDTGYDHVGRALDEGAYTVDGSTIGFRAWHSEKAAWTLDVDDVDSLADDYYPEDVRVGSSTHGMYVTDKRTVRLYR